MSGAYGLWRLSFLESQGGGNIQLQEVAFLDAGGVDRSTGGTPGASSVYTTGYEAANAFDKSNATEWGSAYSSFPARIWYTHPSPVDVRAVRLRYASASAMPPNADAVRLEYCWDGTRFAGWREFLLSVQSGSFTSGGVVVLAVAPRPAEPVRLLGPSASLDMRQLNPTVGVVTDRVMFKATPSSPEQPFAQGRVWLLRAFDGFKAWEGWSDAAGYYTATGLEVGVEYIAVGMDPLRNFKATGAGPVTAVVAP